MVGGLVVVGAAAALFYATDGFAPDSIAADHPVIRNPDDAPVVGDCLAEWPDVADVTTRADVVSCEEEHLSEVIGVVAMPELDRPPRGDELEYFVDDACRLAFADYVGISYDDSELWFGGVPPDEEAWQAGDRSLYCLLESDGYRDGRGSAGGAGV